MVSTKGYTRLWGWAFFIAAGTVFPGCAGNLPSNHSQRIEQRLMPIPATAAPVYSWHATRTGLKTYWGNQRVTVRVRAWLPEGCTNPEEGRWSLHATNEEGVPIPFLGIERRNLNENGHLTSVLIPPVEMSELTDGLYFILWPNAQVQDGRLVALQPTAALCEIRDNSFKPFCVKFPLIPDLTSALTPAPAPLPAAPEGTAIPLAME